MQSPAAPAIERRSSRIPVSLPMLVTSLEPDSNFSQECETLVVSAHGCAIHSPAPMHAGAPLHFQSKQGLRTQAHVVDCRPMNSGRQGWKVAASLDHPQNFWGLKKFPDDWLRWFDSSLAADVRATKKPAAGDDHMHATFAELLQPLQAEITELKAKLATGPARRSNFEISLTHIPPEVEEKLWVRLREDLGAQVLKQTREQSDEVLAAARDSIGKKLREAQNEFHNHLSRELQTVEQRAQILSEEINDSVQQHVTLRLERFQQQVFEAGVHLETRSEDFLRTLQQRLGDDHEIYRSKVQKLQEAHAAESSRLQAQISDLETRISTLNQSARHLESEMDAHLSKVAGDIISAARSQLEGAVEIVLKELGTRNARELASQLEAACGHLRDTQKGIEKSVSELLKTEVAGRLLGFGQTMEELAQESVGRWRMALSRDLSSVANLLGREFREEEPATHSNGNHSD